MLTPMEKPVKNVLSQSVATVSIMSVRVLNLEFGKDLVNMAVFASGLSFHFNPANAGSHVSVIRPLYDVSMTLVNLAAG
ncbi:hypothetical protein Plhal304r1_c045g0126471 [Plasmopara halstedii]